jgi:spermidine/putrescine transport system substrate-binding protein
MLATDRWLLLPAQKALGYSVNTTDEEEIDEVVNLLLNAQDHLLDYDDTTFYTRLVEGEAVLVQAWDGWCNYGIAENEDIRFVVPEEGSDIWVDTMVIPSGAEHPEEALMFIDYILRPDIGAWVVENILYKVPNEAVMSQLDEELLETYPSLAMTPEELLENEFLEDIGDAQLIYTNAVILILASQ